jgi:DNA-binding response OmpR family regulator
MANRTLHVLLVDDDALLRRALARALRAFGWRVTEAVDGVDALRLLDDPGRRVDVLLSDVDMPQLDGIGLWSAARARRAGLPVLLMSGRSHTLPAGAAFLAKPAAPADIRAAVEGLRAAAALTSAA